MVAYFPRFYNVLVARSAVKPEFIFSDMADEFEAPDPGGTEWIFHIRPGVTIAPNTLGVPERDMDAEDALVSFERIKGLDNATAAVFVQEWFESHEAPDPQTYTVTTPTPYAWFLMRMGFFVNNIPPRELIQQDPDRMNQNAVGGGPFSVAAFTEGEGMTLDRNPNYYRTDPNNNDAQLPYIDGMDVKILPDQTTLRTAFIDEQTHIYGADNVDEADELLSQYDVYLGSEDPVNTFIAFTMNVTKPPWDNPNVRKAAMHALNRQQYIDIVYKGGAKANGLVHWPQGPFALPESELETLQPFDPALSRQLLTEAGHELPLKIKVMFPASSAVQEHDKHLPIWLEQMRAAGFEVDQDAQDLLTWLDNYETKNYDASLALNQVYETPEVPLDFHHSRGPAGAETFATGIQDAEVDAAIEAAKRITEPEELVDAIHDVQRLIYDKGPAFLPIVSPLNTTLYWNFVKNIPVGLGATGLLINDWWLEL